MPLNSTDAERQKTANKQLAKKIVLERPMIVALRSLFGTIGQDLEAIFERTGAVPDAEDYSIELSGILARQYRRTNSAFSDNITDFLKDADDDDPTVIILTAFAAEAGMTLNELIANMENETVLRTREFTSTNIAEDNENITETTQKDLDTAIVFGTLALIDQGISRPTRTQVSKAARKSFLRSSRSRPKTIATTVTQKGSEGVKQIENDVFFENRNRGFGVPLQKEEFWITRGDEVVRATHVAADNTKKNANGVFIVGGEQLRFPGDTSLGASAGNVINCLHPDSIVDAIDIKALTRRYYEGVMIRVQLPGGHELTITPNHPILTIKGWIMAKFLNEGDSVIGSLDSDINPEGLNIEDMKTTIEQKFNSFSKLCVLPVSVGKDSGVVNFHGEIPNHNVDIIFPNSFLWNTGNAGVFHAINEKLFSYTDFGTGKFFGNCLLHSTFFKKVFSFCSDSIVGPGNKFLSFFKTGTSHPVVHGFRTISGFNPTMFKRVFNNCSGIPSFFVDSFYRKPIDIVRFYFFKYFFIPNGLYNSPGFESASGPSMLEDGFTTNAFSKRKFGTTSLNRSTGTIETKNVQGIDHIDYSGYVYNLETKSSIYLSEGVINHNCRCSAVLSIDDSDTPLITFES